MMVIDRSTGCYLRIYRTETLLYSLYAHITSAREAVRTFCCCCCCVGYLCLDKVALVCYVVRVICIPAVALDGPSIHSRRLLV